MSGNDKILVKATDNMQPNNHQISNSELVQCLSAPILYFVMKIIAGGTAAPLHYFYFYNSRFATHDLRITCHVLRVTKLTTKF